ncbi:amino acid permease [Actinomadura sp. 9N407]|uniref:amino acid permease n=1 Tax=Actinomadura sp. 9N407 TaxID=3375154 RepID=UPI0037927D50
MGEPAPAARRPDATGTLGLASATALVAGNIVGTGIFLLPASLAGVGTAGIWALAAAWLGAVALALVFRRLNGRGPSPGGPYAYTRDAFGAFPAFLVAWSFWLTAWGVAAGIAMAWAGYVNYFLGWDGLLGRDGTAARIAIALAGIWIAALINVTGFRNAGRFQLVTAVLKCLPLLVVGVAGLIFLNVTGASLGPFDATGGPGSTGGSDSGGSAWQAIWPAAGLVVLVFAGLESAAVAAGRISRPVRDAGRAGLYGVLACGALYLLVTIALFGTVPHDALAASSAPFAAALSVLFGAGPWGAVIAGCAIVAGIGALNGWTMTAAEMARAAARDGAFPEGFARTSRRGASVTGIVAGAALTSLMLLAAGLSGNAFDAILLYVSFTMAVPYLFSVAAWGAQRSRAGNAGAEKIKKARLAGDAGVGMAALLFISALLYGSGLDAVAPGLLALALGVPVFLRTRFRTRLRRDVFPA